MPNQKAGIIGYSTVAQSLGPGFAAKGRDVMLGTREPPNSPAGKAGPPRAPASVPSSKPPPSAKSKYNGTLYGGQS